ncbi:MAG: type III-B CRISPR module RAMP protein Cmr4 [Firmicutes bacterium]|nr:type III-B CRISPR module RAMP protein Cmr4 [Bacillota bacterium]
MKLETRRYLIMTIDPVHVGTGGYRLGRVDNAIVREPGTNLPKIPGSSLHGAIRSAAAMRYGMPESSGLHPKGKPDENPVVYAFGGEDGGFNSGVVNIHDAHILFFPRSSQEGPVWITTASILREAGFTGAEAPSEEDSVFLSCGLHAVDGRFLIGWLMLNAAAQPITLNAPSGNDWQEQVTLKEALSRTVIVHEALFHELVNSGLEVRTSVAIDPETGAAYDPALFTYEAIPRGTFLFFDFEISDYRQIRFPAFECGDLKPKGPSDVVSHGLDLLQYLGIGGMGTRGFGRIEVIGEPISSTTE